MAACAKHYVGDGGTAGGINANDTAATFHELLAVHMPPNYSAVIRGVSTVRVSYSSWNGVKMHDDRFLITDFLKKQHRFRVGLRCAIEFSHKKHANLNFKTIFACLHFRVL